MRSIQEVGTEIFSGKFSKFYIFTGTEYGVKEKYIDIIAKHYNNKVIKADSIDEVLSSMQVKSFIPRQPSLYVIRYDEEFISNLVKNTQTRIKKANIIGTIVCIYEDEVSSNKLAKYLPEFTVRINEVSRSLVIKYLRDDFPELNERLIKLAAQCGTSYGHAKMIAGGLSTCKKDFHQFDDSCFISTFNFLNTANDDYIKTCIASRSYKKAITAYEHYNGEADSFIYLIMNTMLELEKQKSYRSYESSLRQYAGEWTVSDIYNMYMQCYDFIIKLRTYQINSENIILFLISLLRFSKIPEVSSL